MKNKKNYKPLLYLLIALLLISLTISINIVEPKKSDIIGNTTILSEIDNLLLPVANQNITESDFNNLKKLVNDDKYANDEILELTTLAKYNEYSHIGHGLSYLYDYIKTGKEPICPGHFLAHYYVFLNHNENHLAEHSLEEAQETFPEWTSTMNSRNESYLADKNYSYYSELIQSSLDRIKDGDNEISDENISNLAEAHCSS